MQIETKPVPIAEVVRDALLFLEDDPGLKRHIVKLSVEEPEPIVRADRELLKGVFRNLLLNAAQAMHEAGSIELHVARDGNACRVAIADTGPGILPELSSRIFEPFVTGKKGGTGLGLSISRRIMRLHGGELELLSTVAPGATFLLTLPLHAEI